MILDDLSHLLVYSGVWGVLLYAYIRTAAAVIPGFCAEGHETFVVVVHTRRKKNRAFLFFFAICTYTWHLVPVDIQHTQCPR